MGVDEGRGNGREVGVAWRASCTAEVVIVMTATPTGRYAVGQRKSSWVAGVDTGADELEGEKNDLFKTQFKMMWSLYSNTLQLLIH